MKPLIAVLLVLVAGGAIILIGFGGAAYQFVNMYQSAITDPLKDSPATDGGAVRDAMIRWAIFGAIGIVPMVAGKIMLRGLRRRFPGL